MVRFSLYKRRRAKGVYYYVRFWDFDNSSYVKLKNKTKKGSISNSTINNVILSVQKPLNEAFARGMIKVNPMQNISMLGRNQKDRGIPTKSEVEAILESLRKEGLAGRVSMKIYLAVALAATTGMRQER